MCRWPKSRYLKLRSPEVTLLTKIKLLGYDGKITWEKQTKGLRIDLHQIPAGELESDKAWTFVMENVK